MVNKAVKSMQASATDNTIKDFAASGIVRTLKYDNRNRCSAVEHIEHEPVNDQYSSTRVHL